MIFKSGVVIWDLHPKCAEAMKTGGVVDEIVRDLTSKHGVITSVRDEGHGWNSYHYYGRAFDLRTNTMSHEQKHNLEDKMQKELGKDWRIKLEHEDQPQEHIHAEYHGD